VETPTQQPEATTALAGPAKLVARRALNPVRTMLFVGHRGASARSPENTMAALTLACALSDGFECDLQQLRSGNLVTLHDATLWRTATFPNRNGLASLFLRACPVGWLDDAAVADADVGNGEAPPRVDEIMGLALDRQKICFAELKAPEGASAAEVDALACAAAGAAPAGLDHLLTWISFSPDLCEAMKQKSPDHKAFLVAYVHDEAGCRAVAADAAKRGLDGIDVNAGSHATRRAET